ncbi:MAG: LemA family protein [Pseudomonadota bacterium]
MSVSTIILIIIVAIAVILYILYIQVIQKRNAALSALSSVDVQLKKRRDLIPNVLAIAKETMTKEIALIEEATRLRTAAAEAEPSDPKDVDAKQRHLTAEAALTGAMRQIFAVAENYPELRFVEAMQQAQQTYEEVEGQIAAARRFYNSATEDLKNAIEIFPSSMVAGWVKVKPMPFFEMPEADKAPVSAAEFFSA